MANYSAGRAAPTDVEREIRRVLYETGVVETTRDLDAVSAEEAVANYLETNPGGNLASTMMSHRSRLAHFVEWWADVRGEATLDTLDGDDLVAFKQYLQAQGYAPSTLASQLETLGVFLRFCERQDYVAAELPYLVPDVDVREADEVRDRLLDHDRALEIVEYLATFRYASREHVVWLLLAETGVRLCTLVALDCEDYHPPAGDDGGYLELRSRPDTGTRLKNGAKSEREVALPQAVCDVLDDYLAYRRPDATDDHGREPLLATASGRIAGPTIRTYVNKWTAPCTLGEDCPHGRDPAECSAAQNQVDMSCPSKRSPHDVRRGYITYLRRHGVPTEIIAGEVDATVGVLEKHYDRTTKEEQRKMRSAALNAVLDAYET